MNSRLQHTHLLSAFGLLILMGSSTTSHAASRWVKVLPNRSHCLQFSPTCMPEKFFKCVKKGKGKKAYLLCDTTKPLKPTAPVPDYCIQIVNKGGYVDWIPVLCSTKPEPRIHADCTKLQDGRWVLTACPKVHAQSAGFLGLVNTVRHKIIPLAWSKIKCVGHNIYTLIKKNVVVRCIHPR